MTYPKRGEMSEDGKFYTHTDGSVHEMVEQNLTKYEDTCPFCSYGAEGCPFYFNSSKAMCSNGYLRRIEGAYVPSAEEQEACDMAREAMRNCSTHYYWSRPMDIRTCEHNMNHCHSCSCMTSKSCPARIYLAAHGYAKAWEVTP